MKRILKLSLILLTLGMPILWAAPLPAYAVTQRAQQDADACRKKFDYNDSTVTKYHHHVWHDGDSTLANIANDSCFATGGNCKAVQADTPTTYKLQCTKAPATNADSSGSAPDAAYSDPALQLARTGCDKSVCDIVSNYVNPFIKLLSVLVGIAVVIGIIIGSIQFMTSAGDPQKAASGKNHIRNALIAVIGYVLLVGLISWLIPGGML